MSSFYDAVLTCLPAGRDFELSNLRFYEYSIFKNRFPDEIISVHPSLTISSKSHTLELSRFIPSGYLAMAKDLDTINLLPHKEDSFLTLFLNWTVTIGRLLVILTEIAALSTFIYRFSLDMNIIDLHDQIKTKSIIVRNFSDSEKKFRSLQQRLALAKTYDEQSSQIPTVFQQITDIGKGQVTFRNLTVSDEIIKIEAQAPSVSSLKSFVDALKNVPGIAWVSIDRVENKTSNATVIIGITANLASQKKPIAKNANKQPVQTQANSL